MPSATFDTVVSRILDDVYRTDLTAQSQTALRAAIRHYESKPWWPTEARTSIAVTSEYVTLPVEAKKINHVTINNGTVKYTVYRRTFNEIDDWQEASSTGLPTDYCLYNNELRMYPIPDSTYTLNLALDMRLPELTGSAANAWTVHAEELVRRRAAADIAFSILRDAEAFQGFKLLEKEALQAVVSEHTQRVMTGYTRRRR